MAPIPDASATAAVDAGSDASSDPVPALARIAETGPSVAPGMRELARLDEAAPFERTIVHAAERDTCARVAFAASEAVRVSLVDGPSSADTAPSAASGVTGTVCVRRGGDLIVRVTSATSATRPADAGGGGGAARFRAVAFGAP